MNVAEEIKYHGDRALAEIDLARRAASLAAARSHLSLSELHLDRLRALCAAPAPAPAPAPEPRLVAVA